MYLGKLGPKIRSSVVSVGCVSTSWTTWTFCMVLQPSQIKSDEYSIDASVARKAQRELHWVIPGIRFNFPSSR